MSNSVEFWDEQRCFQLMRVYKTKPELWDPKDPSYYKNSVKEAVWKEVGEELNIPFQLCKHKMTVLLSSFRREKAKMKYQKNRTSDSKGYTSKWFAFKELAFLMDKGQRRERKHRTKDRRTHSSDIDEESFLEYQPPPISIDTHSDEQSSSCMSNKIKVPDLQIPGTSSKETVEKDDEITFFTNFVASKMRKYSEATKNAVQDEICRLIFQADKKTHNDNEYDNYTFVKTDNGPINKRVKIERSPTTPSTEVETNTDYSGDD